MKLVELASYREVKKLYEKRSGLIHGGKTEITENDENKSEMYVRSLIFKLIELSEKYTKMEAKSHPKDSEGIEDLIKRVKFS